MIEKPERYEEAIELVKQHQQVSVQFLQRKMRIGYFYGQRIIDQMEEEGHIGPFQGIGVPREVYIK